MVNPNITLANKVRLFGWHINILVGLNLELIFFGWAWWVRRGGGVNLKLYV